MPKSKKYKRSLFARLTKNPVFIAVALTLLVGAGLAYWQLKDKQSASETAADIADTESGEYVNLEPATEVEKQESEDKKVESENRPSPLPTYDGKKQVIPLISFADRSEVRASVPGIFEDGGTCTATATKGSQTETASSKGFKNVSDTQCAPIAWSLSGDGWSVVVSYSSKNAQGKSDATEVN